MAGTRGLYTAVILLSLGALLSSTVAGTKADSRPLDSFNDFSDDSSDGLASDEERKRGAFRSDLGQDRDIRSNRAQLYRWRSFKTDLGKRRGSMFRSDLGRRSALPWNTADHGVDRRRAMFRSDLGKRFPYNYSRRMFRTDLGKRRLMFRHDLG